MQGASSINNDPYAYLGAAASGDIEAIRTLVQLGREIAIEDGDIAATIEALVFARMAAVCGTSDDTRQLLALIGFAEELIACDPQWTEFRDQLRGEAIAIASQLADAGFEEAGLTLLLLSETASIQARHNSMEISERRARDIEQTSEKKTVDVGRDDVRHRLFVGKETPPAARLKSSGQLPLPPGFTLDEQLFGRNAGLPPPPAGFTLDAR